MDDIDRSRKFIWEPGDIRITTFDDLPLADLWRMYDERFGIGTITICGETDESLAEKMRIALRTGKPPVEPELLPVW